MRFKILLFLFVLLFLNFCISNDSFSQLRRVYFENSSNDTYKTSFYSSSEGYVAFKSYIGFTTDSGRTYTRKNITFSNVNYNNYPVNLTFGFQIIGVKAFDRNTILVYGDYGLVPAILLSTDQGNTFKVVFHSQYTAVPNAVIGDMVFPSNALIGYAIDNDRILKTADGGSTWTVSQAILGSNYSNLQALSDNKVYVSTPTAIFTTSDGGSSWQKITVPTSNSFSALFLTSAKGWLTTDGFTYITNNGGSTWTKQISPVSFSCDKLILINDSTGYAIGNAQVYKTTNSGAIWERLHRDNNSGLTIYSLQLMGNMMWVGSAKGSVENSSNSGGNPIPRAIFSIDTIGVGKTSIVKLLNYSKSGYAYTWLVNGKPISNSYNSSYTANIYAANDTIQLVTNNGVYKDTAQIYTAFSKAITINNFTPTSAPAGTTVNITGSNFLGITAVTIGGTPVTSFKVQTTSSISAVLGNGSSGPVKVSSAFTSGSLAGFIFIPPPGITSYIPSTPKAGDTVLITGNNFNNIYSVSFGGTAALSFKVISATQISAVLGAGAAGNIVVSSYNGIATFAGFKVQPVITSVSLASGSFGTALTINGTCLNAVTDVLVDGFPVKTFPGAANTTINVTLGEGVTGNITIKSPGGNYTYVGFKYYNAPKITSFTPTSGPVGTSVTIKGAYFDPTPAKNFVYFGIEKATVTAATDTTLTVTVPVGANYAPINVINNNNMCFSTTSFIVTFNNIAPLGQTAFLSKFNLAVGGAAIKVVASDIKSSNHPDVIIPIITSAGDYALIYPNNSTTGVVNMGAYSIAQYSHSINDGAIDAVPIDWNMDGIQDIAWLGDFGSPGTLIGTASGSTFKSVGTGISYTSSYGYTTTPGNLQISEIDGDGKPDIIATQPKTFFPNALLADLNNDGKPEVLVMSGNNLLVYQNTSTKGNITYATPITLPASGTVTSVTTGDYDNDGKLEIALTVAGTSAGSILIAKNTGVPGTITLNIVKTIAASTSVNNVSSADMDGDGKIDIVAINGVNISIYKNNTTSAINFVSSVDYPQPSVVTSLAIADFDGNSKPDIACYTQGNTAYILSNQIGALAITSFAPKTAYPGDTIIVKGSHFTGATVLTIGGEKQQSFTVRSDSTIAVVLGNKGANGYISITSPTAISNSLTTFSFIPRPNLISISPSTASAGTVLTITGTDFTNTSVVSFGGVTAASYTVVSSTTIIATLGNGAVGAVVITTPAGTLNAYGLFNFVPVPTITATGSPFLLAGGSVTLTAGPNTGFSYQWFKDGTKIIGATGVTYTATQVGAYTVMITLNGVSQTSQPYVIFNSLPVTNFTVAAISATCKGSNNGSVKIKAILNYNYIATITGGTLNSTNSFTDSTVVNNLAAGTYNVCITVANTTYQKCFSVVITEPKDLSVYAASITPGNQVTLTLAGGSSYNINLNGNITTTSASSVTLSLSKGVNTIVVSTDKACQGAVEKDITVSDETLVYPNPFDNLLNLALGKGFIKAANVKVYSTDGKQVYSNTYANTSGVLHLDLSALKSGVYLLKLSADDVDTVFKVIKK